MFITLLTPINIFWWCAFSTLLTAEIAMAQVPAATTDEVRQYEVLVKNKSVGKVSIHIAQVSSDTIKVSTDTSVLAEFFWIKYQYEFHGTEIWQNNRLIKLESRTNDNGTPLIACAVTDARSSRVDIQGKVSRTGPPLAMTTNYWRLPTTSLGGAKFSIIEPDNGIVRVVKLERVGAEAVTVAGHDVSCRHYRLSGDVAAELWFDAYDRLVLQQTVEQGYSTEQRLVRIQQDL